MNSYTITFTITFLPCPALQQLCRMLTAGRALRLNALPHPNFFKFHTPTSGFAGVLRLQSIKEKTKYCGHVLRKQEESFEKDILEVAGTVPGTRRRGRPRISWRDNIGDWTGISMKEVLSSVQDRNRWRRAVHNATKLRSEDG